jgi:hypothetical protein
MDSRHLHLWMGNCLQMAASEICRRLEACAGVKASLRVAWMGRFAAVRTMTCAIMAHSALQAGRVTTTLENMRALRRPQQVLMTLLCFLGQPACHVALWVSSHAQVLPHTQLYMLLICSAKNSCDTA